MSAKTNKSPLELIGERVQNRRKEMNMTQDQFAEKYGYPRTTLAKLEAGLRDFKSTEILILAEQLGVSCDYLLGRQMVKAPDNFTQAASERYGLSEEALNSLRNITTRTDPNVPDLIKTAWGHITASGVLSALNTILTNESCLLMLAMFNQAVKEATNEVTTNRQKVTFASQITPAEFTRFKASQMLTLAIDEASKPTTEGVTNGKHPEN
jgi:transcriptional regulator with XRE-family HTH domain